MKRLIVCADDFGLDIAVNEAVERAHRDGILSCASLMVAEPAAADAVERARHLPSLGVGLHVVVADGRPAAPPGEIPDLLDARGRLDDRLLARGFRYFFSPRVRAQLRREIRAQFEAFRATGLTLDHVNAHKHLHLHPTVASLILEIGREFGMKALRVPQEPGETGFGARALHLWAGLLRRRAEGAGLSVNDHLLGLAASGAMTEERVLALLQHLPEGVSEIYFHPAANHSAALSEAAPGYRHVDEFAALVSPAVRRAVEASSARRVRYQDLR